MSVSIDSVNIGSNLKWAVPVNCIFFFGQQLGSWPINLKCSRTVFNVPFFFAVSARIKPLLLWSWGGAKQRASDITEDTETIAASLALRPTAENHGQNLSCTVHHPNWNNSYPLPKVSPYMTLRYILYPNGDNSSTFTKG